MHLILTCNIVPDGRTDCSTARHVTLPATLPRTSPYTNVNKPKLNIGNSYNKEKLEASSFEKNVTAEPSRVDPQTVSALL